MYANFRSSVFEGSHEYDLGQGSLLGFSHVGISHVQEK
jgi:hypothetical protein